MDIRTAQRTAKDWSDLFCQPFYVIELAAGVYEVTARVTRLHKVVGATSVGEQTGSDRRSVMR